LKQNEIAIVAENISKQYRLGEVGTGTIGHDLNRWWYKVRGKEDPYSQIGEVNDRTSNSDNPYVWALQDINFEVQKGEVLGIIGKNGAGKSTLLKLLSRVTSPTTGTIKARGRIASLLEVGTGFHPEMTGRENIYMNGTILGMTKKEITRKLDEIVDFAGVERYLDTPVKRYSSGMKVRLGFAVAAHLDPEILIVDEVLAVGDAEFQRKAIQKMQNISFNSGKTILFVSHNMASVQNLCTQGILLENGRTIFHGSIDKVIAHYIQQSNIENEGKSLIDRYTDKHQIKVSKIEMLKTETEIAAEACLSGDKITFRIHFICSKSCENVIFRIAIKNTSNQVLLLLNNYTIGNLIHEISGNGIIDFTLDKLPLNSGEYNLDLRIVINRKIDSEIENIMSWNVIEGDFYGTGLLPNDKSGILINYQTKLS
jgi:lipopolysaccharide transport system ATP-binding protein